MNIGTWNVQGIRGKLEEVLRDLRFMRMDIAALTETKKKGQGMEQLDKYIHIYSGVKKDERAKRGISLIISKHLKKYITNWSAVNERILTLNMQYKGYRLTIVGVYAPTNNSDEQEIEEYHDMLEEVLRNIGTSREIILIGDMNARVGRREKNHIVGNHGEDTLNENGERLIDICDRHQLRIMNGYFNHKDIHKYTYIKESLGHRSIIDYVITKQHTSIKIQDVKAHRGPNCGSDHYLVKAKAYLPGKNSTQTQDETPIEQEEITHKKYNTDGLQDDSTRYLYQRRITEHLKSEYTQRTAQELYQHLTTVIDKAACEAVGTIRKRKDTKNFWWNDELETLKKEKDRLHQIWLHTQDLGDRMNAKQARARFKRKVLNQKNEQWEKKCREIETYIGGRRSTESWKFIKSLRSETRNNVNIQIIPNDKWNQYFQTLLTEDRHEFMEQEVQNITLEGEPISIDSETMNKTIKRLKNKRATGPGGIPAELIKYAPRKLHEMIKTLFEKCLNGEAVPQEWKDSWITPIHKKGPRDQCKNYRGLSVSATFSRLYGRVLTDLIVQDYQLYQTEEQSGFRAGRSTVDNIFCVNQLLEKRMAVGRETHMVFIDLTKAYDSIPINKLFKRLEQSPINITIIKAIKDMYNNAKSKVKIGTSLTRGFKVSKGLRQGCSLSPILFNIYLDLALEEWRRKCKGMGVPVGDTSLFTLHYADDQIVIAQDTDDIEYMVRKLDEEYSKWGLNINFQKSEYLCVGGRAQPLQMENGEIILPCEKYTYLGCKIDNNGKCDAMIMDRINKARKTTGALNSILWQKNITIKTKMHIFDAIVNSTLTYGCEVWQISKPLERRLLSTEMDFLRRSARKSRLEHIRNEDVRRLVKRERTVLEDIHRRQLTWYGHVNRMADERLPKIVMNWTPPERRKRGRPRNTWKKGISKAMSERDLRDEDAMDRRAWKLGTGRRPHSL